MLIYHIKKMDFYRCAGFNGTVESNVHLAPELPLLVSLDVGMKCWKL